jgi:hypothetical protein
MLGRWRRKNLLLQGGCLVWSSSSIFFEELRALPEGVRKSLTIDFSLTPCEAVGSAANPDHIVLRPLPGHVWSLKGGNGSAGTDRAYVLDIRKSGISRAQWLQHFAEHIAFARGHDNHCEDDSMLGALGRMATNFLDIFSNSESEAETPESVPEKPALPLKRASSWMSQSTAGTVPVRQRGASAYSLEGGTAEAQPPLQPQKTVAFGPAGDSRTVNPLCKGHAVAVRVASMAARAPSRARGSGPTKKKKKAAGATR